MKKLFFFAIFIINFSYPLPNENQNSLDFTCWLRKRKFKMTVVNNGDVIVRRKMNPIFGTKVSKYTSQFSATSDGSISTGTKNLPLVKDIITQLDATKPHCFNEIASKALMIKYLKKNVKTQNMISQTIDFELLKSPLFEKQFFKNNQR